MSKKKSLYVITLIIGVILIGASFLIRGEEQKIISGMFIGIGAGILGMSISKLVMMYYELKNPSIAKHIEIDSKDERNIIISNYAKARAADITVWLIMLIAFITIIISSPVWLTLLTIGVFLLYNIFVLYFMSKYQKEI